MLFNVVVAAGGCVVESVVAAGGCVVVAADGSCWWEEISDELFPLSAGRKDKAGMSIDTPSTLREPMDRTIVPTNPNISTNPSISLEYFIEWCVAFLGQNIKLMRENAQNNNNEQWW